MTLYVLKEIWRRLDGHDGLSKNLAQFKKCCDAGTHPPRIYKRSGIANDGTRFEPYLILRIWHHHLGRNGDPLLVTQRIDDEHHSIALSTHAAHVHGDKMLWLQQHIKLIEWHGNEELLAKIIAYVPPP